MIAFLLTKHGSGSMMAHHPIGRALAGGREMT
jgi:hypothetical protein